MRFDKNTLKTIRNTKLEIHCLSVRIWQKMANGVELTGHGTIKQNERGTFYIEFVVTNTVYTIASGSRKSFNERIPANPLNPSEKVYAEFEALNNERFTSEGFNLTINLLQKNINKVVYIQLPYVQSVTEQESSSNHHNYLYYEFSEKVDLPANVLNETTSTKGLETSSWDEVNIKYDSFELIIREEKDHTTVKISGTFDTNSMILCANFYIGFSCGVMPQPYFVVERVGSKSVTKIKSIDNHNSRKKSSNPIPSNYGVDGKASGIHSYELFKLIFNLQQSKPRWFASILGQWERVWHGFLSFDEIRELVLSVAIEGLLNDVYIPVFKQTRADSELEIEIKVIIKMFDSLNVSDAYRSRLKGSVSYWKNITAANSLDILVSEGVINSDDKKVWNKLRNESAHPKIKELNSAEKIKKVDDLLDCLNLFHKLILNVIGYTGPVNIFDARQARPLGKIHHIEVLN